jgi:cysteine-rich repeat protein
LILLNLGSGFLRGAAAVVLAVSFVASTSTAADLTGMWHIEYSAVAAELVDVSDVGGAISLTLSSLPENGGIPTLFTGTLAGSALDLTGNCGGTTCWLRAKLHTGNDHFDGRVSIQETLTRIRTFASRCECDDGNTVDGDGCDASCRVEPCFTCAGTPSSCSPIPNGGSCSDHSECTTGDTCSAGICEGSPVAACVDFSGLWHQTDVSSGSTYERLVKVKQRDTFLFFRSFETGTLRDFGTIDPATGDFAVERPSGGDLWCVGTNPLSGTVAPDGLSYEGSGIWGAENLWTCVPFDYDASGSRVCTNFGCFAPIPALTPALRIALAALLSLASVRMLHRTL